MAISDELEEPFQAPSAAIADYLRKSISVSYLLGLVWSGRGIVIITTIIGLLYGVYSVYHAGPFYMATMRVQPAASDTSLDNASGAGSLLAGLTGGGGAAQVPKFIQFTYAMSSLEVARALIQKYDLLCRLYHSQCNPITHQWKPRNSTVYDWIVSATSRLSGLPDPNVGPRNPIDLAAYIEHNLVAQQLKKTDSVMTITYINHDPKFAAQFLSQVVQATNDYVRIQSQETQKRYVEYLTASAAQTTNVEQRQAIDNLLLQEERQLMMTEVDVPYAAQILDGPTVTPVNRALKTIAIFTALGIVLGLAVAMSRDLLPRRWRVW
ncbi:MAG TPA: hypothetical protein VHC39_09000 [Rhizomicrobium sp.]|nr:hypothetical protein [Rhizomicrobium sp.]